MVLSPCSSSIRSSPRSPRCRFRRRSSIRHAIRHARAATASPMRTRLRPGDRQARRAGSALHRSPTRWRATRPAGRCRRTTLSGRRRRRRSGSTNPGLRQTTHRGIVIGRIQLDPTLAKRAFEPRSALVVRVVVLRAVVFRGKRDPAALSVESPELLGGLLEKHPCGRLHLRRLRVLDEYLHVVLIEPTRQTLSHIAHIRACRTR